MSACAVVWCDRPTVARGLCHRCYATYKRAVSPQKSRRYATRETKARVREEATLRRESGDAIADIAASVGVNESTLGKWFRQWKVRPSVGKYGQAPAPNRWKPWTHDDAVIAYTRTDLTISERAELLGRSYTAVAGFVRDYRQRPGDPYKIK